MRFRDLPGHPKLFLDYVDGIPSAAEFCPCRPVEDSLRSHATEVQRHRFPREQLAAGLREQTHLLGLGAKAAENAERLRNPETVVVLALLPAGVLGGPLAALLKLITTIKMVGALERLGFAVVPVVVCAPQAPTESTPLHILDSEGKLIPLAATDDSGKPYPGSVILDSLAAVLGSAELESESFRLIRDNFSPDGAGAAACARFFSALLPGAGIVFVDPATGDFGRLYRDTLEKARQDQSIAERIQLQAARLAERGYDPDLRESALVAALHAALPDLVLPVAAMVVSPEELGDVALTCPVSQGLGYQPLLAWPSAGATIVDPRSRKILEKYHRDLGDLFQGPEPLLESILSELLPPNSNPAFESVAEEVEQRLNSLQATLPAEDRSLESEIEEARTRIVYQLAKLRDRFQSASQMRREAISRQIHRVCHSLAPGRQRQELQVAAVHFLLRYSRSFVDSLLDNIDVYTHEHKVIYL